MKSELERLISQRIIDSKFCWNDQVKLAETTSATLSEVETAALTQGILPVRYQRNLNAISIQEQCILSKSRVAVVGCGGLGGVVIEELARLGVGSITAWDFDFFEEHNINRQINAQLNTVGKSKVEIAAQKVAGINPAVEFIGVPGKFDKELGIQLLNNIQVVVDALDNIPTRMILAEVSRNLDLPLVHGAVGGWFGQVTTQFPGDDTLDQLYGQVDTPQGLEVSQGILSFVPGVVASLQTAEVIKILLKRGTLLREKVMFVNLLDMEIEIIELNSSI